MGNLSWANVEQSMHFRKLGVGMDGVFHWLAGLLLRISPRLCPRETPRSSPASPWKTPSIPPLLLRLTQSSAVGFPSNHIERLMSHHQLTKTCNQLRLANPTVKYACQHSPLNVDGSTLWLAYMLKQLLGSSLMEILKPGCPRNVESDFFPDPLGPSAR